MNVNERKTLEARQRRLERSKSRREFLCRCVDSKPELDNSVKDYFKNKINNLEIRDEKTLISEIEEFETEEKFLNLYDGEETISNSQKDILKGKIRNNEITDKETLKKEIIILKEKEKEEKRKELLLRIVDNMAKSLMYDVGFEGYLNIRSKINDNEIKNRLTLQKEINRMKKEKEVERFNDLRKNEERRRRNRREEELLSYVKKLNILAKGSSLNRPVREELRTLVLNGKLKTKGDIDKEKEKIIKKKVKKMNEKEPIPYSTLRGSSSSSDTYASYRDDYEEDYTYYKDLYG